MTAHGAPHTWISAGPAQDLSAVLAVQATYAGLFNRLHSSMPKHLQALSRQAGGQHQAQV